MRMIGKMVLLASISTLALACGGSEDKRPARAPTTGTTQTTSAALSVTSSPSTNATMAPVATPVAAPVRRPVMVETASAVMRVTTARCDREAECSNVGTGKEYGDRDECVNSVGHAYVGTLTSDACPGGVDADALAACTRDVQAEPCGDAAGAIDRLTSCSRDRLCASPF